MRELLGKCKHLTSYKKLVALRLLRGGQKVPYAARIAGVNRRTVQRWMKIYMRSGLEELLAGKDAKSSRYHEPYASQEDLQALGEAVVAGKVVTYKEAHVFLKAERNVVCKDTASVYRLMQKHNMLIKDLLPTKAKRKARAGHSGDGSS